MRPSTAPTRPVALTIAGSDPSGGAGLQADLKTFQRHGVYGASAITMITVQNSLGVRSVQLVDPPLVEAQIVAVLEDMGAHTIKTGALGSAAIIDVVARVLERRSTVPIVVDPVMLSKNGNPLLERDAVKALRDRLLGQARLVTPNAPEAAELAGVGPIRSIEDAVRAGEAVLRLGPRAVLVKGGHLDDAHVSTDVLLDQGSAPVTYPQPRVHTRHTHGTGCTLSAAITAQLALGLPLQTAYERARGYLQRALQAAPGCACRGIGPLDHGVDIERSSDQR
jgi:hydroxymethylpyrimidine/phosphomethylpyrimidine kinase